MSVGKIGVLDLVQTTQLEAAPRVVHRRLCPTEHGVDPRALPFSANEVHTSPRLPPVETRGVGRVEHAVVVLGGAIWRLDQRPDLVEEVDRQLPAIPRG